MTTHTDRKSAEILAALDKLAENGMPFIDVVKQGGFSGFPANGVQPLPTEPVQVHEDPGAAYWKEATKMAEHTDRIRQMAQEAGIDVNADTLCRYDGWLDPITRFAQLVAEDERSKWASVVVEMHRAADAYGCGYYDEDSWLKPYRKLREMAGLPAVD